MALSPTIIYVLAALLAVGGVAFLYFIVQTSPSRRIQGGAAWVGVILSVAVVVSALSLGTLTYLKGAGYDLGGDGSAVGRPAPELAFRLVDTDEQQRLSDYRGQVVLLNLWATWCAPCLEELPELNRLQETYGPRGVAVLTISDEPREALQVFEEDVPLKTVSGYLPNEYDWPVPFDRVEGARPTTFVIDRQGTIQATWPGIADYDAFVAAVAPHL